MKLKLLSVLLILWINSRAFAQDFPGFRAGNYTGVNGVFFNPASIADSRYRYDFNFISVSSGFGNNAASYNISSLTKSLNVDSLRNEIIGTDAGLSSAFVSVDLRGPSLMLNTGRKSGFAVTSRFRTMANIIDLDGQLASRAIDNMDEIDAGQSIYPYHIKSNAHMQIIANSWVEFGVSYARILKDEGRHFLKGGLSLKYLGGIANAYVNINKLNGVLEEETPGGDVYLANTTGSVGVGVGGINISEVDYASFNKLKSKGFGVDLGWVYEFRPDHESYKMGEEQEWMRDRNKYKVKVGVALLDVGLIKYTRDVNKSGEYNIDITGNERFYVDEFSDAEVENYNDFLSSKPQFFTPTADNSKATYNVSLPTTLQVDVDYRLHRGFYAQLAAQLPVSSKKIYNARYYSNISLTPRYEGKAIGLYLPLSYNSLTHFNAGVSLRMGPLFIGSGSALTAAFGNSKQADVHVGIHFAGLQKNLYKKEQKRLKRAKKRSQES